MPHTCADLKTLGPAAKTLTPDEISNIEPDEFFNCLSTLGDVDGWSSEQGTALLDALKEVCIFIIGCYIFSLAPKTLRIIETYFMCFISGHWCSLVVCPWRYPFEGHEEDRLPPPQGGYLMSGKSERECDDHSGVSRDVDRGAGNAVRQ